MRWPWQRRREVRESDGAFADAVLRAIEAEAAGTAADNAATGAVEAAAGALSRAFAGATVEGPQWVQAAVTGDVLGLVGRDLIRRGESLHAIRMSGGMVRLIPVRVLALGGGARSRVLDRARDGLRAVHVHDLALAPVERGFRPLGR